MIASAWEIAVWGGWALTAAVGVALGAVYCGMETGIYVLNKARLDLHAAGGRRAARGLKAMLANANNLLAVLLIGTNLTAYMVTFAVSAMYFHGGAARNTEWWTIATATPLLFVVGEGVPKNIFQRSGETLVYALVWVLRVSSVLFNAIGLAPLVRAFAWVSLRMIPSGGGSQISGRQQLRAVLADSAVSGVLTHSQTVMADRIMHIGKVTLDQAMTPISRTVTVRSDTTRDGLVASLAAHSFSRLPVVDRAGRIVGIINIYDVLLDETISQPADVMIEPTALPAGITVTDALYRMKQANAAMAVVTDAAGRQTGIVTIKDLVEEIVGELAAW